MTRGIQVAYLSADDPAGSGAGWYWFQAGHPRMHPEGPFQTAHAAYEAACGRVVVGTVVTRP